MSVKIRCSRCNNLEFSAKTVCPNEEECPAKSLYQKLKDGHSLPHLYIGLAGGKTAGKTYYLLSLIQNLIYPENELEKFLIRKKLRVQFAHDKSEESFRKLYDVSVVKQLLGTQQIGDRMVDSFDLFFISGTGSKEKYTIISLFNSSGETYEASENEIHNRHEVREVNSFLYFIDPIHDSGFGDYFKQYTGSAKNKDIISRLKQILKLQEDNRTYEKLRIPIAVNISKFDLLETKIALQKPYINIAEMSSSIIEQNSKQFREILQQNSKTVRPDNVDRMFSNVKYFAIAPIGHDSIKNEPSNLSPKGIYAPFFWLLNEFRIIEL